MLGGVAQLVGAVGFGVRPRVRGDEFESVWSGGGAQGLRQVDDVQSLAVTEPKPRADTADTPDRTDWWRTSVTYQMYIRSFADADGDGLGDVEGMRSRLPYLAALGVDAVWINPWYPSPQADGGYDVADYRDVEPAFGTLDDGQRFIDDAHAHGIRVILDIVPNHTSDQHAWFAAALAAGPGSRASAPATSSGPGGARTANCRRTTGRRRSAGRPGSG